MCSGPKWKREVVPDHKFDFVDSREFTDNGFVMRMKYLWLFGIVLKSFLVYVSDIFTAVTMLSTNNWSNEIFKRCDQIPGCVSIPFNVGKWLFVGCIIFSFLLLAYESRKSKKIIASRDISYAFTNIMANHYYSLRSYDHFCFFAHISNSTKKSDDFAFFVFFTFKTWKRVLLADGPRQTINALTLYAVWLVRHNDEGAFYDVRKYFKGNSLSTNALQISTFFTVVVFIGSFGLLVIAGICYIPLLMHIRGNLKEYCCHKVDKRIDDVIKRRQRQRVKDNARLMKLEMDGNYSHLKNKKGELVAKPLPQPTLPNLSVDDDDDYSSMHTRGPAPSTHTQDSYQYNDMKSDYPPPMPQYNPYSHHQQPDLYGQFNPSQASFPGTEDQYYQPQMYSNEGNDSQANLAAGAAPYAQQQHYSPMDRPGTAASQRTYQQHQNPYIDPVDAYYGRESPLTQPQAPGGLRRNGSGLAYDDQSSVSNDIPTGLKPGTIDPYGGYSSGPTTPMDHSRHYDERQTGGYR